VWADSRVTLKSITTGRDSGTSQEVLAGLAPGEDIIVNPSDSLETGARVRVLQPKSNSPPPATQPAQQATSAGNT